MARTGDLATWLQWERMWWTSVSRKALEWDGRSQPYCGERRDQPYALKGQHASQTPALGSPSWEAHSPWLPSCNPSSWILSLMLSLSQALAGGIPTPGELQLNQMGSSEARRT